MQYSVALLGALAVLPAVNCVAFGGPAPTVFSPNRVLEVWSPKPTKGPSIAELRRRQSNLFPETCGWQSGDLSSAVTCKYGNTCMMYTASSSGMIGCCDGPDLQSCGWVNSCVDYEAIISGSCTGDCKTNSFALKCSASSAPYCISWTYPSNNIKDYGCGTDPLSTYETVFQEASEFLDSTSTSISLPTVSGNAVTGWGSTDGAAGATATETDSYLSDPTELPSGGGTKKTKKTKTKVNLGVIIGIAAGAFLLFIIVAGIIIICCVKQKKKRQALANQQAIAAAQASRPQSQFNPQMPQQQMQQVPPPMPQTPTQGMEGYFKPAIDPQSPYIQQAEPQKFNPQTQVHEYPVQSPISNPPTPAPAYSQPYHAPNNGQFVPPIPTQSPAPYQMRGPTPGAHEVDAISVPQAPQGQQGQREPVYEMGNGR
ncbi:hypothetical protein K469DRAFT_743770 [Zopfia rhizophila CBS 207.26]|uniref:Mid2 domain-containing protein n=1 Tax=Zopfia rhizophila CBS 207.26 TaxID=1314779 RepID=A0A6A6EWG4_9PEZI|nr:hypothetical protein K469DRAFT_743770 [Zopfia rhizophila CBS 207.26]